ncbi:rskn-1 [Symbiodinium sp. CCMP2592]|nr:rskn-1 [Symbiodinium sp. CCMP2592]
MLYTSLPRCCRCFAATCLLLRLHRALAAAPSARANEEQVPLYLWVQDEIKERFLEMCNEENVSISEMLTRWAATRSTALSIPAVRPRAEARSHGADVGTASVGASTSSIDRGEQTPRSGASSTVALRSAELDGDFLLKLGDDDLKLLRRKAKKHGPLIATWTTGEAKYMSLAMNLALSIRKNAPGLERNFLCVALDRAARRAMRKRKFHTLSHPVPQGPALKDAIWKMRWLVLHTFAHLGIDGLVLDSDIVILQDPFPALWGDADFEVMTDHFWPEQHLWQYWTRPEEHINTGCIFVKASVRTKAFLYEFLEHHNESEVGGLQRHWMDQQVFNKFVEHRLFHSTADLVHGLYGNQVFRNIRAQQTAQPIRLRVLDPKVIAHGMNFFWLRAHEGAGQKSPALAHANGVDGKEYFLRDRGQWYIDDFAERFGDQSFVSYEHPPGMSLAQDFQHLVEAVVVAAALRRRLVLPNTMNCEHCPALEPYKATTVLSDGNCTFDYFAWSQSFLGHHGDLVAESGLRREASYRSLPETRYTGSQFAKALGSREGRFLKIESSRRLHLLDIRAAYKEVNTAGFGPQEVFQCRHHDWPVGWMACRDQRFVKYHGQFSKCKAHEAQPGCGYRGITCCDAFWGWGEKLEYFTGKPWDLPCNCGLSGCEEKPQDQADASRVCCGHTSGGAARCDRRIRSESVPEVNTPEDSESLTSTALADLGSSFRNVTAFWQTCRLNRQLRFSDRTVDELIFACHRLATRYLLLKQNFDALGQWCRFAHRELRRGANGQNPGLFPPTWPGAAALPVRDAETGALEEISQDQLSWKRPHDVAQLQFLEENVRHLRQKAQEMQTLVLDSPRGIPYPGNRATFVPELRFADVFRVGALESVQDLAHPEFLVVDRVLRPEVADQLQTWLAQATIWHSPKDGGILQASLLDALNGEGLIELIKAFGACEQVQSVLHKHHGAKLVLDDMWAWKYDLSWRNPSLPVESDSWVGSAPDVLAVVSFKETGAEDGWSFARGSEKHFIPRRQNQLVLWTAWKGGWSLSMAQNMDVRYEDRPVDLFLGFRKSLGHKVYPGLTAHTSTRWPAAAKPG